MENEVMTDANQEETTETPTQEAVNKTYTQKEFDDAQAGLKRAERKKYEAKYKDVDLDAYQQFQQEKEQAELESQKQRGEFDQILKTAVEKKDTEIADLRAKLSTNEIDGALLTSASQLGAIAPDQVSSLLRNQVQLNDDGKAEVVDTNGNPRYTDSGELMKPSELVSEFLTASPHFVKASQGGTGSTGNAGGSTPKQKSVADMTMDEYREYRQDIGRGTVGKAHIG